MELDGRFSKGYYRYARAESLMGHKEEATKYARHGLSIDPACEDLRHLLVNELGVSASDLPANPNVKIQEEQTSTVPVVQGVAVSSTQMEQQQPLMMQGQQPMMMQGQQPMMMQGQQPMMMQGQQPMMMQGQQPMMMQGQQPMMMQGQQPMMMQGQQPMMMQGQQPMMVQQQPMMMQPGPGQRGSRPQDNNTEVAAATIAGLVGGAMLGGMFG